jgi:acetyl-CoA carboxylase carboxyltransferase component
MSLRHIEGMEWGCLLNKTSEFMENQKIEELQKKLEEAQQGGGQKAIAKQKSMGKLTARERILLLVDEGSFLE